MAKAFDEASVLAEMERLALAAGRAILRIVADGFAVESKADATPVTRADRAAEDVILEGLALLYPDVSIVAEEQFSAGRRPAAAAEFFLVDALDGTREFVAGRSDYTVNIALVSDGAPRLGVVFAPAHGLLWSGRPGAAWQVSDALGDNPLRRAISAGPPGEPLRIVASRSHRTPETDVYLARHANAETVSVGSSMKFCRLAGGEADLYPRFGRTMEWDTAAGDAVLRAAGGMTETLDGAPLTYGKAPDYANPYFIARGA